MKELSHDQAELVSRLAWLNHRIKELTQDADSIKSELRRIGRDTFAVGDKEVLRISENHRFSAEKAKSILPPEVFELIRTETVDTEKAKAILPPEVYAACQAPVGKDKVTLL